jgi:hypothetical protein
MNRKRMSLIVLGVMIAGTVAFVAMAPTPVQAFNCKIVSCPAPQCLEGEHLQTPPGECCPQCVPD